MEKDKVQNKKVQPDDEISNEDLDKVAGGISISLPLSPIGKSPIKVKLKKLASVL